MAQDAHMLSVSIGDGNVYSGDITGNFNHSFYKSHKLCDALSTGAK